MGYSRQQSYEIRRNSSTYDAQGLLDRLPGPRGPHPNRVAPEVEEAVLAHAMEHPCHGALRIEQELRLKNIQVSAGDVRGVWSVRLEPDGVCGAVLDAFELEQRLVGLAVVK